MGATGPFTMAMEPKHLQLDAVIGFEGTVQNGLIFHPDGQHLIYPLGSTVVIRDLSTSHSQRFLHGHVDKVSTVTLSPCGHSGTISRCAISPDQGLCISVGH